MRLMEIIVALDVADGSDVDVEGLQDELERAAYHWPGVVGVNVDVNKDEEC